MTFDDILEQVITFLKRQGRVSYRALKLRFDLDDEYLDILKAEILYSRARELCQQVEDTSHIFPVLFGLWGFSLVRGEIQTSQEVTEQLLTLAQCHHDPACLLPSHRALGTTLFCAGTFAQALTHLEQGMAIYDPQHHHAHILLYRQDPGVGCFGFAALSQWVLGYPDHARRRCYEGLHQAQALSHPLSLAMTLFWTTWLHQFSREAHIAQEHVETLLAVAQEQNFAHMRAYGTVMQGWVVDMQEPEKGGSVLMSQGLEAYRALGAGVNQPYFLSLLAEAHGRSGHVEEGLRLLTEGLRLVDKTDERWWEAELHRLKGELLLQRSSDHTAEAVSSLHHALDVARRQQAKSWELRAATSLARLWLSQGKRQEAHDLLALVYNWFTEGFDTADVQEAKALLEELGEPFGLHHRE